MRGTSHGVNRAARGRSEDTAWVLGVAQLVLDLLAAQVPLDALVAVEHAPDTVEDAGGHARLEEVEFRPDRAVELGQVGDDRHHLVAVGAADDRRRVGRGDEEVVGLVEVLLRPVSHPREHVQLAPGGDPDTPDDVLRVVGQVVSHGDMLLSEQGR